MRKLAQHALSAVALVAPLTLVTSGCPTNGAPIDANFVAPDAAIVFPDAPLAPDSCATDQLRVVRAALGITDMVMFDTTMSDTRPRDLGLECGNPVARRWAAEEIIEYHVPGTGPVGVTFTTQNMGTDESFNTLVQVRTACATIPAPSASPTCFDDVSGTDARTTGGVQVMGGDTIYLVVTGYSDPAPVTMTVDTGRVRIDIVSNPNTAPTLTAATASLTPTSLDIVASGNDAEGNVAGYTFGLSTSAGRVDFNGDGVGNAADIFAVPFTSRTGAPPAWEGRASMTTQGVAAFCMRMGVSCTSATLVAYDSAFLLSNELVVPIRTPVVVGVGEACDPDHICGTGMACLGDPAVCTISPAATAACGMAAVLAVPTPTTMTTRANVMTTLVAGSPGLFSAPAMCAPMSADGVERIFRIDVPMGTYDLTVTTQLAGTAATDTVLYVRGTCLDASTSLGCQDDIGGMVRSSTVEVRGVTEGDYYAFVESYSAEAGPVQFEASLRPVLATGAACDPAGMQNRCAGGACPAGTMVCP